MIRTKSDKSRDALCIVLYGRKNENNSTFLSCPFLSSIKILGRRIPSIYAIIEWHGRTIDNSQGGSLYGDGGQKQYVGGEYAQHVEQESERAVTEPAKGLFGHEDQQRRR